MRRYAAEDRYSSGTVRSESESESGNDTSATRGEPEINLESESGLVSVRVSPSSRMRSAPRIAALLRPAHRFHRCGALLIPGAVADPGGGVTGRQLHPLPPRVGKNRMVLHAYRRKPPLGGFFRWAKSGFFGGKKRFWS